MASSASGTCSLERLLDRLRERRRVRRRVAAHHRADPLEIPVGLHAVQRGAHLGEHLLLVVAGEHAAVHAQLDAGRVDVHGDAVAVHDRRREGEAVERLDHVGELYVAARELDERRARRLRVAQALAQRGRVDEQAHELLGRAVDDQRQLVRDERVDHARRADDGVAAAQRHRRVAGLALDDEAELRRALLAALEDVDAAAAALEEVPAALVDHVVGLDQVGAVLDEPAGAADAALLLVGGAGVDERAGGGAALRRRCAPRPRRGRRPGS